MNEGLNMQAVVVDDPRLWHEAGGFADISRACRGFLDGRGDRSDEELRYAAALHYRENAAARAARTRRGRAGR